MNTNRIKFLFDWFAPNYDKCMIETNRVNVQLFLIGSFLNWIKGNVLDIATGTGTIANYIKDKTCCNVYGIDFSQEMIKEARGKIRDVNFTVGKVSNLPYSNNFFDTVVCSHGFYWFENITTTIQEVKRVLKPNGFFISLEGKLKGKNKPKQIFFEKELEELADLQNYIGVDFLESMIKKEGFSLIKKICLSVDKDYDTIGMLYQNER